jgi:hypothetical protein
VAFVCRTKSSGGVYKAALYAEARHLGGFNERCLTRAVTGRCGRAGLTRGLLASDFGASEPGLLADNFAFVGPLVGPLPKVRHTPVVCGMHDVS